MTISNRDSMEQGLDNGGGGGSVGCWLGLGADNQEEARQSRAALAGMAQGYGNIDPVMLKVCVPLSCVCASFCCPSVTARLSLSFFFV